MEKKICIFGAGGFGKEVYCLAIDSGWKDSVICFLESDDIWLDREVLGLPVKPFSYFNPALHMALVAVGDPAQREKIIHRFPYETQFPKLVHPSVIMSDWVELDEGSIICAGNILTCNIKIGKHAQLNLGSTIGHDCVIGDFFTVAPSVNISGHNIIGNRVYIGTNAATREKLHIGDDVVIGMGSVVVKDIMEAGVYAGNPARKIK